MNLADTIRQITKDHILQKNGVLLAQNATDNGFISNTVPSDLWKGIITLPTSDVSNSGIVTGFGLAGKRPIYAIRYQGFGWLNFSNLVNYAAKVKTMSNGKITCPIFVRCIGMEGHIGPVASHSHHSIVAHMPGIKVFAPMSVWEYNEVYNRFMEDDEPYLISEFRKSYSLEDDLAWDTYYNRTVEADVSLFLVGGARMAQLGQDIHNTKLKFNIFNVWELKPLNLLDKWIEQANKTRFSVVVDSDYAYCGVADSIAKEVMLRSGKPCYTLGLDNRVAGFSKETDVLTPTAQDIIRFCERNYHYDPIY